MAQNKSWKELMELQGQTGGSSQQKANAMLDLIEGRKPFSYDPNTDPAAKAARQETARNIARTTKDTLGGYATMTGGMPSSAAVSAAAQAGSQAAVTGADRIAELEQLARQNYLNEGSQMQAYWSMLQGQADNEYQKVQAARTQEIELAKLAALYGDNSKLKALGIDVDAGGAGGYYRDSNPVLIDDEDPDDDKPLAPKLDQVTINELRDKYEYELPEDVWAQYDAAALMAAGFRKRVSKSAGGSSGNKKNLVNMVM